MIWVKKKTKTKKVTGRKKNLVLCKDIQKKIDFLFFELLSSHCAHYVFDCAFYLNNASCYDIV